MKRPVRFTAAIIVLFSVHLCWSQLPTVPPVTGSDVPRDQAQQALDFHNTKRQEVNVPPLKWSSRLAADAQRWAEHLAIQNHCQLAHNPNDVHGENLFSGTGAAYTALYASQSWYSEIKDFRSHILTESNWAKTGHYTQMVWRTTEQVGIGVATCLNGTVVVAEYDPPGNYLNKSPY